MRAVVLGGTGALGGAAAARLAARGWSVDVTGRDPGAMPATLAEAGVRFHAVDRADTRAIETLVSTGADLLVDLVAFRARDVRELLPTLTSVAGAVLVSSRAVYVDPRGRHINGDEPPRFDGPIAEDTPTLAPAGDDVDPFTREGYAPSKVAAEQTALGSGLPITVLRPSKVHGRWARNARTRSFVEAMLRGDPAILLRDGGSIDHLTAADNAAALIEAVANDPGTRILNAADPTTPTAAAVVQAIAARLGWTGRLDLAPDDGVGSPGEALRNPWTAVHPVVLDTAASLRLGYVPVGSALDLLAAEVDWLRG